MASEAKAKEPEQEADAAASSSALPEKGATDNVMEPADEKESTLDETKKEADAEKAKEDKKDEEFEQDSKTDDRDRIDASAAFISEVDSTLNVMQTSGGSLFMSLGEGGMQYLLAGARATVGIKSGRYMFEVRIAESLTHAEPATPSPTAPKAPVPKQLVRVGVSLGGSSLILGDTQDNVSFDSEGFFSHGRKRAKSGAKFGVGTIAVLVNLDESSVNSNTISLFKNGVRMCQPQPIPESFRGKPLFPAITYRNVTLEANLGPQARSKMPFKCRMLSDAAVDDVVVVAGRPGATNEVVFPVGLPDRGVFDWMDGFLAKHPEYTELSDRKIIEWAVKSGMWKPKGAGSNDKPSLHFGLPLMDDGSVRRVLVSIAPTLKRNYVIGEVKANLVPAERAEAISSFSAPHFRKKACVIMGDPNEEHVELVQKALLAEKIAVAELEKKRKAVDDQRKRLLEEKKRKAEEARKSKLIAQKKKEGDHVETEDGEKKEESECKMDVDETSEVIELTEEEKKVVHRKTDTPDVSEVVFAKSFTSFALPSDEEGFDEVAYEWQPADECAKVLKAYIHELKLTQKAEDLTPSPWFKERWSAWQKQLTEWKKKATEWKDPVKRKALLAKKAEALKEEGKTEPAAIDMEELDVLAVEDVSDVGSGEPLYANFVYEDWALLSARYEVNLLLHAFKRDLDDPERPTFQESHLGFYYQKYFHKTFNLGSFSCTKTSEYVALIKDIVAIDVDSKLLKVQLDEDTEAAMFVKLTEEHRRDRQRRVDAGDETALLKFARPAPAPPSRPPGSSATAVAAAAQAVAGQKRAWAPVQAPGFQGNFSAPAWKQPRTTYAAPLPNPYAAYRR
jgi:heterogeneous nuclear ribonucleoprotein U-like protein 1